MFQYVFAPILERLGVPVQDRTYIMRFCIQGLMGVLSEWPSSFKLQEPMLLSIFSISMKKENWTKNQPVGNSDRFDKKATGLYPGRCHIITLT
jgi:hypothetical protein